jgi:putative transposase
LANLSQREHSALTPFLLPAFGNDAAERRQAYRDPLRGPLPDELSADIRIHLQQQRAMGHDAFRAMVEANTSRFAGVRPAHRPRSPTTADR